MTTSSTVIVAAQEALSADARLRQPSSIGGSRLIAADNLEYIRASDEAIDLKGIDVNPRAIDYALSKRLPIDFEVIDANDWAEPEGRWDGVLTMSVLDHIPDAATERLAGNIARSATHVIDIELWNGSDGGARRVQVQPGHRGAL